MVVVYFDYGSASEIVAIVDDESLYDSLRLALELTAKDNGATLSESVISDEKEIDAALKILKNQNV